MTTTAHASLALALAAANAGLLGGCSAPGGAHETADATPALRQLPAGAHPEPSASRAMPSSPTAAPASRDAVAPDTVNLEDLLPAIARVDVEDAELLRTHPAVATLERLPFYPAAGLLRVAAYLPQPVAFRYVYVPGERRVYQTGTPELVRAANAAAGLRLSPDVAVTYVRFYLEVAGNAGWAGRRLAASANDIPWLPATETDPAARAVRARLSSRINPATVAPSLNGGLRVTTATVRGQAIEIVSFGVAADGTVTEGQVTTVATDAPVVQVL